MESVKNIFIFLYMLIIKLFIGAGIITYSILPVYAQMTHEVSLSAIEYAAEVSNKLAFEFLHEISNNEKHIDFRGNFIFSPLTISKMLYVLKGASQYKTYDEIIKLLKIQGNEKKFSDGMKKLLEKTEKLSGVEFDTNFFVFHNKKLKFKSNFIKFVNSIKNSDFLIDNTLLSPGTNIVKKNQKIINFEFKSKFDGKWYYPFPVNKSRDMRFRKINGEEKYTTFMEVKKNFSDCRLDGLEMVCIPYEKKKVSMYIVKSQKYFEFLDLISKFSFKKFMKMKARLRSEYELNIIIPKFEISWQSNFNRILKNLGIKNLFIWSQDLNKIIEFGNNHYWRNNLMMKLKKIEYKSKIEIDEQGTIVIDKLFISILPEFASMQSQFRVNSPFVFIIYDEENKNIIYLGRVMEPKVGSKSYYKNIVFFIFSCFSFILIFLFLKKREKQKIVILDKNGKKYDYNDFGYYWAILLDQILLILICYFIFFEIKFGVLEVFIIYIFLYYTIKFDDLRIIELSIGKYFLNINYEKMDEKKINYVKIVFKMILKLISRLSKIILYWFIFPMCVIYIIFFIVGIFW